MGYGLRVTNDSGQIQIDGTYRNLCKTDYGDNLTLTYANTAGGYFNTVNITASPLPPLIAIRPDPNYPVCIVGYGKTGSNYDKFYVAGSALGNPTIDWVCYRQVPSVSADAYGLRVYDSSSNIVFDSGKTYLKIVSVTNIDISASATATQNVDHVGLNNPYYILSPQTLCVRTTSGGGGLVQWVKAGLIQVDADTVQTTWVPMLTQIGGSPGENWLCNNGLFKLIVTSYVG